MSAIREFREQYTDLSLVERSALRTVALGLGFVVGLCVGWLLGDTWRGAAIGSVAGFGLFVALVWGV